MAEIIISSGELATLLGKNSSEIESSFIKDDKPIPAGEASKLLARLVKDKVTANVERERQRLDPDMVRQKARKEVLSEVNSKFSELGIDGEDWKSQLAKASDMIKSTPKEITESDIRNSEVYKKDLATLKKSLEDEKAAHQETLKSHQVEKDNQTISDWAKSYLSNPANKYAAIEDQDVANRRFSDLLRSLKNGDHKIIIKEGKRVVIDSKGQVAKDDHFNDITPEQLLEQNAKYYYTKQVTNPKSTPPLNPKPGDDPKGGNKFTFPTMQTQDDLQRELDNAIREKKGKEYTTALVEHFKKSQPTG